MVKLADSLEFEEQSKYEILTNTISIIEQLKSVKIHVEFMKGKFANLKKSLKNISITIGTSQDKISTKTRVERELAKIVFDSPYSEFSAHARTIRTNAVNSLSDRNLFLRYIHQIFDILESRRTETCYGQIYRGALERFIQARPIECKEKYPQEEMPVDPIAALEMARHDCIEQVQKSEFAVATDYIKGVELTGKKGAFDLAIMYWEKVVQPFLEKISPESQSNSESYGDDSKKTLSDSRAKISELEKKIERYQKEIEETTLPIKKKVLKMAKRQAESELQKQRDGSGLLAQFSSPVKIWTGRTTSFENIIQSQKESGLREIAEIEEQIGRITGEKILTTYGWSKIKKNIINVEPKSKSKVNFNQSAAQKLKNIFKRIQGGRYVEIDSVGDDIDVDSYIDFRINRIGNFLKSTRNFVGFDIIIAIDESGSMLNEVAKVKRMCATLYEAISDLPNVQLTIVGWSGNSNYCEIKKISSPNEIGSLDARGGTPIGTAVWYCKNLIDKLTSPKCIFFLITDGQPNEKEDVEVAKEGIKMMRKKGIMCNGICVGIDDEKFTFFMREIFGNQFAVCDDYQHVDKFLTKNISNQIIKSLKRANYG